MGKLGAVMKAFDAAVMVRELAKRFTAPAGDSAPTGSPVGPGGMATTTSPESAVGRHLEATLTNVVVAALKEAFERDHARLELERLQIEEQRRRAEETLRLELRRQAADREVGRLRLLAATALVGWIASIVMFAGRGAAAGTPARAALAGGWILLLGALGAAFHAQGRLGAYVPDGTRPLDTGPAGTAALWLLLAGLAAAALSLLL
jgi:hypothetical protein